MEVCTEFISRLFVMHEYIKYKLKVINDFCIELTESELKHINGLNSEAAIDKYVRSIIRERLEPEQNENEESSPPYIRYTGQIFGAVSVLTDRRSTALHSS